jgi:hypothetical protein
MQKEILEMNTAFLLVAQDNGKARFSRGPVPRLLFARDPEKIVRKVSLGR